ncbi:MAG: TetR family transcriptional regulator [Gammaproteobacteria bacterium]
MSASRHSRAPGRPTRDLDLRDKLLEECCSECAAHGFRGASVRAIAAQAGATPAMVNYYFGDKRGMYRAMLTHKLGPLLTTIREHAANAAAERDPLPLFIRAYMSRLAECPEIPILLVRDVLSAGGEMRDEFISGFAKHGAAAVARMVELDKAAGRLRADLDSRLAALSLLSLCAFPFLAAPVAGPALGYAPDADFVEQLADHTIRLFYEGAHA